MDPLTNVHGMIVHFPIALLFVSFLLEVLALIPKYQAALRPAALVTLVIGAIGGMASVLSAPEDNARGVTMLMHTHEQWAHYTMFIFGALVVWRLWLLWRKRSFSGVQVIAYLLIAAVGLGTLTYTGYLGGKMVYDEAIGVKRDGKMVVQPKERGFFGPRPGQGQGK